MDEAEGRLRWENGRLTIASLAFNEQLSSLKPVEWVNEVLTSRSPQPGRMSKAKPVMELSWQEEG